MILKAIRENWKILSRVISSDLPFRNISVKLLQSMDQRAQSVALSVAL